jgi:hypothetical protein
MWRPTSPRARPAASAPEDAGGPIGGCSVGVAAYEPPMTADDLLRVRYRPVVTQPSGAPLGLFGALGTMLFLGGLVLGFSSPLAIVGGAVGGLLVLFGVSWDLVRPRWAGLSGRSAGGRSPAAPRLRGGWFGGLLLVGLVFLGVGSLLVAISVWFLIIALPAIAAGAVLTIYGAIGVGAGVIARLWSRFG